MNSLIHFFCGLMGASIVVVPLFLLFHGVPVITLMAVLLAIAGFIVSIPVHEMIHGVTCAYVSDNNYKTISYGISLKGLHAYCRYQLPIATNVRNIVSLMPGIVLGLIPAIVGVAIGNVAVCIFAILNLAGASGDVHAAYNLRKYVRAQRRR